MNDTSLKRHATILGGYLAGALAAYYIFGHLMFGKGTVDLFLVLAMGISVVIGFVSIMEIAKGKEKISVLGGMVMMFLACVPLLPHAFTASKVNELLDFAERNTGTPAPVSSELRTILSDRELFAQNRSFISDFGSGATAQTHEVLRFIDRAQNLGVDSSFVSENGIVRVSDKQNLYRAALEHASQGNEYAISLFENNPDILANK